MGPGLELQVAVKTLLEADASLQTLMGGTFKVYDHIPDELDFPYILYEANEMNEWDTSTETGWVFTPRIHAFSKKEGSLQARQITDRIETLLHNADLVPTGYNCVLFRREGNQCIREPDGQVWHSFTSFRALVEV